MKGRGQRTKTFGGGGGGGGGSGGVVEGVASPNENVSWVAMAMLVQERPGSIRHWATRAKEPGGVEGYEYRERRGLQRERERDGLKQRPALNNKKKMEGIVQETYQGRKKLQGG